MPRPLTRPPKYGLTDGAKALRKHLDKIGQSIPDFCEEHEIDRIACQRAMNGDRLRISIDFALSIERATKGTIKAAAWKQTAEMRAHTGTEG